MRHFCNSWTEEWDVSVIVELKNSSIKNGIFPDELKIAKVVPIFKANDK